MSHKSSKPATPDYVGLANQQAAIDQNAVNYQTTANRPNQNGIFGSIQWSKDPATGQWTQNELIDPRVAGLINTSLGQAQAQANQNAALINNPNYKVVAGGALFNPAALNMAAYDPKSGDAYAKQFAQSLLARVTPQQAEDKRQMELKLRLQGLEPGSEAYNRAYQNLLTSQGDVQAQAQLQGMLAGGQESRDIYNTRLQSALGIQGNARENYTTRMQGQQQMNDQAMKAYLMPYQTAGLKQDLLQGTFAPYLPSYQGFGTAQGAPGANLMGATQQAYAQAMQNANDRAAKRSQMGSAIGSAIGSYYGSTGSAAGGAIGSYFSDAALKDDIRVISDEDAYKVMMKIAPHSFSWPSGARAAGLIAQDVAEELPALVQVAEGGYLKVNYEAFTALLLGAFRHLAKQVQEG